MLAGVSSRNCLRHIFFVKRHKTSVQCRGVGIFGSLGLGDLHDQLEFQTIPDISFRHSSVSNKSIRRDRRKEVIDSYPVAAESGLGHSVVLTNDGKLYLFGRAFDIKTAVRIYRIKWYSNYIAKFLTNFTIEFDDKQKDVLTSPFHMPGLDRYVFTKVACSGALTAALTSTGQVFCFGLNRFGQCGTGELKGRYWFPTVNVGVPPVLNVDVGLQHGICLCVGGDVYTWGKGNHGQIGNGEEVEANPHSTRVPLHVKAVSVGAGFNHCAAIGEDGNVYVWGRRMSEALVEGSKATYQDQYYPRCMTLPNNMRATEVYCSSFTTVVKAIDETMWIFGVDEVDQEVTIDFQPVFSAISYHKDGYTVEELQNLPKEKFSAEGCVIKKGYHAVSVISACQQKVFEVTLQRGVARLQEIIVDPRKEGRIVDYSAGFRHVLMLTSNDV